MTRKAKPTAIRLPVPREQIPDFSPVPRKSQRHDGWTPERQRGFIEALADTGSVDAACKAVNMSTEGAYQLRRQPGAESFRAAWLAALDLGVERLEDVAMERALNGVEEPFYVYGKHVGTRTRYNDRLLMFMLRNRSPERFGASVGGGSMKGLNAVGKMEKRRLKKKWRKQWEDERAKVTPADLRAGIDRKIENIRQAVEREQQAQWERLSDETHAAWARFVELRDRDCAALGITDGSARPLDQSPHAVLTLRSALDKPEAEPDAGPEDGAGDGPSGGAGDSAGDGAPPEPDPKPQGPRIWHSPKDSHW